MKKLIFKKFYTDTLAFFSSSILIMGLIVWTLQAVNYFDFVTEDGHGLKVYFFFSFLNFPKIIHRILPFIFFISLFYTLINYELRNELSIFWINGVSKIKFVNKLITYSIILMFFQILLGSYMSPISQLKARDYLKNSNIDFFTSLIKEGKFINVAKDLTIFIDRKNNDGSYSDIFIEDSRNNNSKMIYAKNGILIDNGVQKKFQLVSGRVINNEKSKINIFDFDKIDLNLTNLTTKTITTPKIQEIDTFTLINCLRNVEKEKIESFRCDKNLQKEIKQEIFKRIYKPIYIPIIALVCGFLIINSKNKINYRKNNNLVFIFTFIILLFSEASLRYSTSSEFLTMVYLFIPFIIFISSYLIFYRMVRHV